MSSEVLVSIIIPIYNTEIDKLMRCINSVLSLSNDNYEVLLIDDGSDKYIKKNINSINNEKLHYFYQDNNGVSSARNKGISYASGRYIMFLDSDDYIDTKKTSEVFELSLTHDLYLFNAKIHTSKKKSKYLFDKEIANKKIDYLSILKTLLLTDKLNPPWSKLYSREIINNYNIKFNEEMISGEDLIFNMKFIEHCSNIYYLNEVIYHYEYDVNTGLNRIKNYPDLVLNDICKAYNQKLELAKKQFNNDIYNELIEKYTSKLFGYTCSLLTFQLYSNQRRQKIRSIISGIYKENEIKKFQLKLKYELLTCSSLFPLKSIAYIRSKYLNIK